MLLPLARLLGRWFVPMSKTLHCPAYHGCFVLSTKLTQYNNTAKMRRMDKSNFITMQQLATALGISRQYVYRINESIGTVTINGIMCVSRTAALAYVDAQIRQLSFRIDQLRDARIEIIMSDMDDNEVTE